MSRLPLPVPYGWFQALYSDELEPGSVRALQYVGRALVAFRGERGEAHVLDAHCPHLGAHLGVGGRVAGDHLRCPFHAWEYDGSGRCVRIPYARRIPAAARVRSYPTLERNGVLYFWYHGHDEPPSFAVPRMPEWGDPEYTSSWLRREWVLATHPQEIMENGIDWPHIMPVHHMQPPRPFDYSFEGPRYDWRIGTSKPLEPLAGQPDALQIHAQNWGLGIVQVRFRGLFSTAFHIGYTPVDSQRTRLSFGILARRAGQSDEQTRMLLAAYLEDQVRTLEQDFALWENKIYRAQPALCEADGPIAEFRRWAQQFYAA